MNAEVPVEPLDFESALQLVKRTDEAGGQSFTFDSFRYHYVKATIMPNGFVIFDVQQRDTGTRQFYRTNLEQLGAMIGQLDRHLLAVAASNAKHKQ